MRNHNMPFKEIHREIEHASDKVRLTLYFPSEPSPSCPSDALRQEIRTILGRELSTQLQCRKQKPAEQKYVEQVPMPQAAGKALP